MHLCYAAVLVTCTAGLTVKYGQRKLELKSSLDLLVSCMQAFVSLLDSAVPILLECTPTANEQTVDVSVVYAWHLSSDRYEWLACKTG